MQLPFLPIIFTACGVLGIVTTSASYVLYGSYLWNPLDIIHHWLDSGSHGGRAAAFFAGLSWYIAQVGTNITANSISAANDLTVMFPRYVNIKRGCVIAAVVGGWVIVPWKILSSAETFLSFMGGYAVFLAPIAGIIASDYWLVKRQNIDVPALYDPRGRYRYKGGVNWRAVVAMLLAICPNLPGLAYSINPTGTHITTGAKNLYTFDWLYGFVTAIVVYTSCSLIFPAKESLIPTAIFALQDQQYSSSDDIEGMGHRKSEVSTGLAKGFGDIDGVDVLGATRHQPHHQHHVHGSTEKIG